MISNDCLRDAVRHLRWAHEDITEGELLRAMINLIAANRFHAMSGAFGSPSWVRIDRLLRSTTKMLWRAIGVGVAPMPLEAARGNA